MAKGWLYPWGIGSIAFGGASLVVPLYLVTLGGDAFDLGVLTAVAAFLGFPGGLIVGRLADRTGRRRSYVLACLGAAGSLLITLAFLRSIPFVIAANGPVWFSFAAAMPVLNLLAVTDVPPTEWSSHIARLNKFQGIGWAGGLLIGAVWTGVGLRMFDTEVVLRNLLIVLGISCLVGLLWGFRVFPGDPTPVTVPSPRRLRRAVRQAKPFNVRLGTYPFVPIRVDVRDLHPTRAITKFTPTLSMFFAAIFLAFAGFSAFFAPLPAFLVDTGFHSDAIFLLYLASAVASAAVFEAVGSLSRRHDVSILIAVALSSRSGSFVLVALVVGSLGATAVGHGLIAVLFVIVGLTWAVIAVTATTLVSHLTPRGIHGESLGMYAAVCALAGGIGSVFGGWVAIHSYLVAFACAGLLILGGTALVVYIRDQGRQRAGATT